jgi:four helix bundle protein
MTSGLEAGGWRLEAGKTGYGNAVQDLEIWNRAMGLAERIYRLSAVLPADERFGLVSQLRRAAVSVPSNIAEGHGHGRGKACANFVRHARGSLSEIRTQVLLCVRLGLVVEDQVRDLTAEIDILQAQLHCFILTQDEP